MTWDDFRTYFAEVTVCRLRPFDALKDNETARVHGNMTLACEPHRVCTVTEVCARWGWTYVDPLPNATFCEPVPTDPFGEGARTSGRA